MEFPFLSAPLQIQKSPVISLYNVVYAVPLQRRQKKDCSSFIVPFFNQKSCYQTALFYCPDNLSGSSPPAMCAGTLLMVHEQKRHTVVCSFLYSWTLADLNRSPFPCHGNALPDELRALSTAPLYVFRQKLKGFLYRFNLNK